MKIQFRKRDPRKAITAALLFVFIFLACAGCENKKRDDPPPTPEQVFISGNVTDGSNPIPGAAVRALDASDRERGTTSTLANGQFQLEMAKNSQASLQIAANGFETWRSAVYTMSDHVTGLDIVLRPQETLEDIIDRAFGGMMLDVEDRAWLAIDVHDEDNREIDGAVITVNPRPVAGGTLLCGGSLTGSVITSAPCIPPRRGPMYLAYYDAPTDVEITLNRDNSRVYQSTVRVGEVAYVELIQLSENPQGFLSINVEAGGRITTEPDVIRCNGNDSGTGNTTCETEVAHGTVLRITAFSDSGYVFDDWDGCDVETTDGINPVCIETVSVQAQSLIRAEFDPR